MNLTRSLKILLSISLTVNFVMAAAIFFGITGQATMSGLARTIREKLNISSAAPSNAERNMIACWGDSLTAGTGAGLKRDYCSVLAAQLNRQAFNGGIGGETSTQIGTRMINRPPGLDSGLTIIWAGRNNYEEPKEVEYDIEKMVTSLPVDAQYLILGPIAGYYPNEAEGLSGHEKLRALNSNLENIYRDRFVNLFKFFSDTSSRSSEKFFCESTSLPARCLRSDQIHLNERGYQEVAKIVLTHITTIQTSRKK